MLVWHRSKQVSVLANDPLLAWSRVGNSSLSAARPELTAPGGAWAVLGTGQFGSRRMQTGRSPLLLDGLLFKHCRTQAWTRKKK